MGTGTTGSTTIAQNTRTKFEFTTRKRVILLNGPPGVGKDTIGDILARGGFGKLCSFKTTLFNIALTTSCMSESEWFIRYNNRELKETPWDRLNGMSQREFLIKISEEWVKPAFGQDYFGIAAKAHAAAIGDDCIFTDSGFESEVKPLIDAGYEVVLFRLHREGYNFKGDSRSYLFDVVEREYDITLRDNVPMAAVADIVSLL